MPEKAKRPGLTPNRIDWGPKAHWFAAEYMIVVLGVLTAIVLNAWWSGRQDRAREQSYLRQLHAELAATEREASRIDHSMRDAELARHSIHRSFYEPVRPPADSLVGWLAKANLVLQLQPTTMTLTALVSNGGLALIEEDSLRSAIAAYANDVERLVSLQSVEIERWLDNSMTVLAWTDGADMAELYRGYGDGWMTESIAPRMLPRGERRTPFASTETGS